jgi:hypothetical protein
MKKSTMKSLRWAGMALFMTVGMGGCLPFCAVGSVDGEIDGEALPGMSSGAWYLAYEGDGFNDYVFVMSTIGNACEAIAAQIEANSKATKALSDAAVSGDPDEITAAREEAANTMSAWWDEFIGSNEDHWSFSANVVAAKLGDVGDKSFDLVEGSFASEVGQAAVSAGHQMGKPDYKKFYDDSDTAALKNTSYFHESGKLEMGGVEEGGAAAGAGEAKMLKQDPDDYTKTQEAGSITFDFGVPHCPEAEEAQKKANEG